MVGFFERESWPSMKKIRNMLFLSFRRKPWFDELTTLSIAEGESSCVRMFWTPAFAGVTNGWTPYETVEKPASERLMENA